MWGHVEQAVTDGWAAGFGVGSGGGNDMRILTRLVLEGQYFAADILSAVGDDRHHLRLIETQVFAADKIQLVVDDQGTYQHDHVDGELSNHQDLPQGRVAGAF